MSVKMNREDGVLIDSKENVKEVWKSHLEQLVNEKNAKGSNGN